MPDTLSFRGAPAEGDYIGGIAIDYSGGDQSFTRQVRALYVGTAGHFKVDTADGSTITLSNLLAGHTYRVYATKVYQTGSTAAGVALY